MLTRESTKRTSRIIRMNRRQVRLVLAAAALAGLLGASVIGLRAIEAKSVGNSRASKANVTDYSNSISAAQISPVSATTGATYWVNAYDADGHDGNPGDGICQVKYLIGITDWILDANGIHPPRPIYRTYCTLRAAIEEANAHSGADTINFVRCASNSGCTISINDRFFDVNGQKAQGEIPITDDLTINGVGADRLILDAGGVNRIFSIENKTISISGLTLQNGFSSQGGAVSVTGGSLTLDNVHVKQNSGPTGSLSSGGGIYYLGGSHHIRNSTFSNNVTGRSGGAVALDNIGPNDAKLNIVNSTFFNNTSSQYAGALAVSNGEATISNSTFSGNTAHLGGGALSSFAGGFKTPTITLRNSTISGNTADGAQSTGGGVLNNGNLDIGSTIIAENSGGFYPEICNASGSTATSAGYNLIGSSNGRAAATGIPITYQPTDTLDAEPKLGPLQDNGGSSFTRIPAADSPAVDKGNSFGSQTDQRGGVRPIDIPTIQNADGGDGTDIGAYEIGALWSTTPATSRMLSPVMRPAKPRRETEFAPCGRQSRN